MRQAEFEAQYERSWARFERAIGTLASRSRTEVDDELTPEAFPAAYREVCHHLALARARRYGLGLQTRLNQLALEGHRVLYRERPSWWRQFGHFLDVELPRAVRAHWRYMAVSAVCLLGPMVLLVWLMQDRPGLIYSIADGNTVMSIERMYADDRELLGEREADSNFLMFGFYIYNNVGIGFRTFAGGLLFGIGTLFFLIYNGVFIGGVSGYLNTMPYRENFWSFVVGHGAFELTAIVMFGAAGLRLGMALLAPGRRRRWHSVRDAGRTVLPVVVGATVFMLIAAFVEAYWSSQTWPGFAAKYAVGGVLWFAVLAYLFLKDTRATR